MAKLTLHMPVAWMPSIGVLPQEVDKPESVNVKVKDALVQAFQSPLDTAAAQELSEDLEGSAGKLRISVYLPEETYMAMQSYARPHKLGDAVAAKRILAQIYLGYLERPEFKEKEVLIDPNHPIAKLNADRGRSARIEQLEFYNNIWCALDTKQIGVLEAGTGIGKTLAILASAARWVQKYQSNCVIAVPTLAILRQFKNEYNLQAEKTANFPPLRVIVGKREFVSEYELDNFLSTRGKQWDTPEIREWMVRGLPAIIPDFAEDTAWQVGWFDTIAPGFPVSEVLLNEMAVSSDAGMKAYRKQFTKIDCILEDGTLVPMPPSIVVCTHAMLANDMRTKMRAARKDEDFQKMQQQKNELLQKIKALKDMGIAKGNYAELSIELKEQIKAMGEKAKDLTAEIGTIPNYTALIVDEGHQLEENFSNSLGDSISLSRLISNLKEFKRLGGSVPAQCITNAENAIGTVIHAGKYAGGQDYSALASQGVETINALSEIAAVCEKLPNVRDESSERYRVGQIIKKEAYMLKRATNEGRNSAYLRFSPVRKFPQLIMGQRTVADVLSQLWTCCTGAAVVSATLYLQNKDEPNANYSSILLNVPESRRMTAAPIMAPWSTRPVREVFTPQNNGNWLHPPNMKAVKVAASEVKGDQEGVIQSIYAKEESRWHDEVAQEVQKIWQSAAGGVLVLCTSYTTVKALQERLTSACPKIQMVVASSELPLAKQSRQFMEIQHAGEPKPLWVAVGGAWTGLDVGGHEPWANIFGDQINPEQDNVVTDLVIPRLPFKTNRSLTHMWRCANQTAMPWDILDAAFRFKQALGRLVRRKGLPQNRRIFVLDARMTDTSQLGKFAPFERILKVYGDIKLIQK